MSAQPIEIFTAGYHHWRTSMPPQAVNIARRPSELWQRVGSGRHLQLLYPNDNVWVAHHRGDNWKALYREQMNRLIETDKILMLFALLQDRDVLMCWERSANHCHRQIAASFLATVSCGRVFYAGEVTPKVKANPVSATPSLFGRGEG
jgi:hypothetical protein